MPNFSLICRLEVVEVSMKLMASLAPAQAEVEAEVVAKADHLKLNSKLQVLVRPGLLILILILY